MKTNLPEKIETVEQAKSFLTELYKNGEVFHPEDDAMDVDFNLPEDQIPTDKERKLLNKLMEDIYNLPGNKDKYPDLAFDPCGFILELDPDYVKMMNEDMAQEAGIIGTEVYGEAD